MMSGGLHGSDPSSRSWVDSRTVRVLSAERPTYLPRQAQPEPDRHQATIVTALTLACTVLSVYDLFLLASGLR